VDGAAIRFPSAWTLQNDPHDLWSALQAQVQEYAEVPLLRVNTTSGHDIPTVNYVNLASAVNQEGGAAILITMDVEHGGSYGVFWAWRDFDNDVFRPDLENYWVSELLTATDDEFDSGVAWLFSIGA
jgi:hypothetical protein